MGNREPFSLLAACEQHSNTVLKAQSTFRLEVKAMGRRTLLGVGLLASSWSVTNGQEAFYPEGHFDYVTKFTDVSSFENYLETSILPTGKTSFVRNNDVAFGDVVLKDAPDFRGEPHNPGRGGWPTIRYFNEKTGTTGGNYVKLTSDPMCTELGDRMKMIDYVESYGNTVLCDLDGTNCTEQELKYLEKYKEKPIMEIQNQLSRLEKMVSDKALKDTLRLWIYRRMRILKRLLDAALSTTEL